MKPEESIEVLKRELLIRECLIEDVNSFISDCNVDDDEFDDEKEQYEIGLSRYKKEKEVIETAISALEEVQQYRKIGTVEECREAVEKQKPTKPHRNYSKFHGLWCKCGWYLGDKQCLDIKYCPNCGQAIDTENLEGNI